MAIEVVSATRLSENDFWAKSALGLSLKRLSFDPRLVTHIAFSNRRGLPEIFNARITEGLGQGPLVFIHDDVWIDDYHFGDRITEGLNTYDVVGVVGNRRRLEKQPAWAAVYSNNKLEWDDKTQLSGAVAHGPDPFGKVGYFGRVPASCELLDGVLLAAKRSTLKTKNVLFDTQFDFHFYDMDFCRTARERGLKLGTWPISITHQSTGGGYETPQWKHKYDQYIEKWKE
jgi:Glycosyltransferase like family